MELKAVLNYWFPDELYHEYWFDGSQDEYIKNNFYKTLAEFEIINLDLDLDYSTNDLLAIIIVLDQFSRNIYRDTSDIYKNDKKAFELAEYLIKKNLDLIMPINHRIFLLMPYRHQKKSDLLDYILKKINNYEIEFPKNTILNKFKCATLRSYSELTDRIVEINNNNLNNLDLKLYSDILDDNCKLFYIDNLNKLNIIKLELNLELNLELYKVIKNYFEKIFPDFEDRIIGISLSGGVDSMVILYLCKILEINKIIKKTYAVHIEYSNRDIFINKKETEFITKYCNLLEIPIFIRIINHMTRDDKNIEREFYEEETKKIRFNTYKYLVLNYNIKGFCMGHHFGDLGENVLMNIFNGRDILDLYVMSPDSVINNIRLFRPLLNNSKDLIFEFAHSQQIPYFKDSTPNWSCRGVIRAKIMPALKAQYGTGILTNLADLGEKSREWAHVVNTFVLEPIYSSIVFKKNGALLNIIEKYLDLPTVVWLQIFLKIFHSLGINMITKKNLTNVIKNIKNNYINNKNSAIIFSNKYSGIYSNAKLYIFKKLNLNINCLELKPEISYSKKITKITYDDVLDGYYMYINNIYNKKLFSNIFNCELKNKIFQITQKIDNTKLAQIEIFFN